MLRLFFPEAKGQLDYVGYNHAVSLMDKTIGDRLFAFQDKGIDARMYCNLPWNPSPRSLKKGLPLIYYTMFETTKVPNGWVKFLNNHVDIILVPSTWNYSNFRESGVKRPMFVVPLGFDPEEFQRVEKTEMKENYVFIWHGVTFDRFGRKGFDVAVDAFKELKKEGRLGKEAKLIVKTKPHFSGDIDLSLDNGEGIVYEHNLRGKESMKKLYACVDCCVNPTHGEGFGFIPLEQMAMGIPVIAPNWSMPYLKEGCFVPVDYSLKPSSTTWTHKSFHYSLNGIAFNIGGLAHEIRFMPKRALGFKSTLNEPITVAGLQTVGDGYKGPSRRLYNGLNNVLAVSQRRLGFIFDKRRKRRQVLFENQGLDAWVSKDDLKEKMMFCYLQREHAKAIGEEGMKYVNENWTINETRKVFESIEPQLYQILQRSK